MRPSHFAPLGKMKMLYSPPEYGGITTQTSTSHLMQDDAFDDSAPPAVSNPNGVATLQTALPCIAGSKDTVLMNWSRMTIFFAL